MYFSDVYVVSFWRVYLKYIVARIYKKEKYTTYCVPFNPMVGGVQYVLCRNPCVKGMEAFVGDTLKKGVSRLNHQHQPTKQTSADSVIIPLGKVLYLG